MYSDKKIKNAIKNAIDNVIKEGITDVEIFNRPFELNLLENQAVRKDIIEKIYSQIKNGKFTEMLFRKNGRVYVPKKSLCDFRKCALIDVFDEIKYLTLVILVAPEIEKDRINKTKKKIFSYRYLPNKGYLFDRDYHYTSFRKHVLEKTKSSKNKILVECDISNFYDRLNLHRLESVLLSIKNIDIDTVNLINELLLFWANRDSYGLPVGSNASRILAEAALIEVDNYLISKKINFCRFVDDYRIFAEDANTAQRHLSILINSLNREGLFLNSSKTRIKDISHMENSVSDLFDQINDGSGNSWNIDNLPKIIRGYSGIIPTKFRKLTDSEERKLKENNFENTMNRLYNDILLEPKRFIEVNKTLVAQKQFSQFPKILEITNKLPQFIPYVIDILLKYGLQFEEETVKEVKMQLLLWFDLEDIPEYILIYLVRAFSTGVIADKNILLDYFRNSKRVAGDYIGRALLESFNGKLSRGEVLEIRDYYVRADVWEKRQILKLIRNTLFPGERRAYFKDIKMHNDDIFIGYIINEKEEHKKLINKEKR